MNKVGKSHAMVAMLSESCVGEVDGARHALYQDLAQRGSDADVHPEATARSASRAWL